MPARKRAGGTTFSVKTADFGWDAARVATLEHPTLPWYRSGDEESSLHGAASLAELGDGGPREKLSVLGQFAAHCAFLRFAGLSPTEFDPAEWIVVRRRGADSRLVRIRARSANGHSDIPLVSTVEAFAAIVGIDSLENLQQSWVRPEAVYAEIVRKLQGDIAASLEWFRAAARGSLRSPGEQVLNALTGVPSTLLFTDPEVSEVVREFAELGADAPPLFVFGGEGTSPLRRYSGVQSLGRKVESETAEMIADRVPRAIAVVHDIESFDESSRALVHGLLQTARSWSWVLPMAASSWPRQEPQEAPPSRLFLISQRVAAAAEIARDLAEWPQRQQREWLDAFLCSDEFEPFVCRGVLPQWRGEVSAIAEPQRSYLAALSILGQRVHLDLARELLSEIGCCLVLNEVAVEPLAEIRGNEFVFRTEPIRRRLQDSIPTASRQGLAALAAGLVERRGDSYRSARLYQQSGDGERALRILESMEWPPRTVLRLADEFPHPLVQRSAFLSGECARALIAVGRYQDAYPFAAVARAEDRPLLIARILRRFGDLSGALGHLEGVTGSSAAVARAELYRLQARYEEAERELWSARVSPQAERPRREFEAALLALDRAALPPALPNLKQDAYLEARWRSYESMGRRDYGSAVWAATQALTLAPDLPAEVDAAMDLLYARFLAGDWEEARHEARRALSLVEQTQGDRAAGGILFTLAYLCADSAHWSEAEFALARLDSFYRGVNDERRLDELRMLRAHLAFCRGRFTEARQHLARGADARWSEDIREAAHLILDEIDWIEGNLTVVRTSGASTCVELNRRHELNQARSTGSVRGGLVDPFSMALIRFESGGGGPPAPPNRSARLRLFRSLSRLLRRQHNEEFEALHKAIADELGIDRRETRVGEGLFASELQLLQLLGSARFPFSPSDLGGFHWRMVTRNRLGQWSQLGSLAPLTPSDLSRLEQELSQDWISCGESAYLYLEGLSHFSPRSRDAVRSLFALQSESFRLRRVAEQDQLSVADRPGSVDGILGESQPIREAVGMIERVARRDVPVCILGESGTGKELFARAVHLRSPRRHRSFTAVNCAALPENLIESELFGHVRGAYTGAERDRAGLIEVSDGGTLFLDEIGELPPAAQAKLLRFLQEGEYRRVGETQLRKADVRLIAATNCRLDQAVDAGTFREDLYYRLGGLELTIPPLRDRGADILLLAKTFLAREREKHRGGPSHFSDEVEAVLLSYGWPGNVRELENAVRSSHALAGEGSGIETEHLPKRLQSVLVVRTPKGTFQEELVRFRRGLIEQSLLQSAGNQNRAAKTLGMTRQALAYQIRELGIMVTDYRKPLG